MEESFLVYILGTELRSVKFKQTAILSLSDFLKLDL